MGIKSGWTTSEFWSKNAVQAVAIGAAAYAIYTGHDVTPEQKTKIIATAGSIVGTLEAGYMFVRGYLKKE